MRARTTTGVQPTGACFDFAFCYPYLPENLDGDAETLWQNWSHGLHRVTCYGDLTEDLRRLSRFKGITLVDEASPAPPEAEV